LIDVGYLSIFQVSTAIPIKNKKVSDMFCWKYYLLSMKRMFLLLFVIVLCSCNSYGEAAPEVIISTHSSDDADFNLIQAANRIEHPWSFAFLPDNSVLITLRMGKLLQLKNGIINEITGLPDIPAGGQGGLLDIVLHPDFKSNKLLYFSHSAVIGSGTGTAVSRGYFTGKTLRGIERIFTSNIGSGSSYHYGSRLAFGTEGLLYITLGERGDSSRAQDTGDHAGSVLRVNDDGAIPADNPFISEGGLAEIYTYGHRNQQGIAVDPLTGSVWLHEHGPKGGDELNKISAGANYGWPLVTYGRNYDGTIISPDTEAPGIEPSLLNWVPSIAPSGMAFYSGSGFPAWQNDIFIGALAGKHIRRIIRNGEIITGQEILIQNIVGRIRDVRTGPDGNLWFITDEKNGGLYRIEPLE